MREKERKSERFVCEREIVTKTILEGWIIKHSPRKVLFYEVLSLISYFQDHL